jgi:hypothetical protein
MTVSRGTLRSMTRVPRTSYVLVLAVLAVLTACSGGDASEPDWSPLPAVDHPPAAAPQLRDQQQVWASLARLDPCALLDPAAARVKGFPRDLEPEARSPHSCEIERPADYYDVTAYVGVELTAEARFTRARVDLAGTVGYLASQPLGTLCRLALPVSDLHAIEFTGDSAQPGCREVRSFAAAAARRLSDDSPALLHAPGPDRRVACDLLSDAVGPLPPTRALRSGASFTESLDDCGVWRTTGPRLGLTGQQLQAVAPETRLRIEYSSPIREFYADGYRGSYRRLRGTEVHVEDSTECDVAWNAWPADVPAADAGDVAHARVTAATCRQAERIAGRVMAALERPAPRHRPIAPLTYRTDEPDTGAPGACADLADQAARECASYVDVEVPDDPVDLIRSAEADANVDCAAAADAVHETFGDDLQPVTATGVGPVVLDEDSQPLPLRDCVFVEPTHRLVVAVRFSSEPVGGESDEEVAGHPAVWSAEAAGSAPAHRREVRVALTAGDDRGHLWLSVAVHPHRRTGMYSDSAVDRTPLEHVEPLAELLAEQRFG